MRSIRPPLWLAFWAPFAPLPCFAQTAPAPGPVQSAPTNGPIAIHFTLPRSAWVTLVIDDAKGRRVRNLLADCSFPAGENTVYWDGSDDLGRDPQAASHGLYLIPGRLVSPGQYTLRGLWRDKVSVLYEHALYSAGRTPWETADTSGGWLSNHTPPQSLLFLPDAGLGQPGMLIGSYVSEGTAGLAWTDLEGKKQKHQVWVGGAWTGAPYLARDVGTEAVSTDLAYAAVAWTPDVNPRTAKNPDGEIRVTAITVKGDRAVGKYRFRPPVPVENAAAGEARWKTQIGGLAVHDGRAVVSLTALDQLLLMDVKTGSVLGQVPLAAPRGLAFDAKGSLFALSQDRLVLFANFTSTSPANAPVPETVCEGLDKPVGLLAAQDDTFYIGQRGQSHTVQHRDAHGRLLSTFGRPGVPAAGPYDEGHMNNPAGLALDPAGRLWVAEEDFQPKRVSIWNADGSLHRAFYGPADYGGGGALDPKDPTRFYYRGMAMKLGADGGTKVENVFSRSAPGNLRLAWRSGGPQTPLYRDGQRYFTNAYNSNPTNGHGTAFIFQEQDGVARPVAGAGVANEWELLKTPPFQPLWPAGTDSSWLGGAPGMARSGPFTAFFVWSDLNEDGGVQPNEVTLTKARTGGVTVLPDFSIVVARFDDKAVRLDPTGITPGGVPCYDLAKARTIVEGINAPTSTGGDQVLPGPDGWSIFTTAPKPFSPLGIAGVKNGVPMWTYPSLWPGLHASHESAVPDQPGELIGTTRLLGPPVAPRGGEPLWFINGNLGPIYVFTFDGLFVAQLFQDMRVGPRWNMPEATPGMSLESLSPSDENFWPSVSQGPDGQVYLVTGRPNALAKITGLESIRRLPTQALTVTKADLARAGDALAAVEIARQKAQGEKVAPVPREGAPITADGRMEDWAGAEWMQIDKRGNKGYFQSSARPYDVSGALAVRGEKLYAAWRTGDADLLQNSGDVPLAPFKTGGALDLMLGAPGADPARTKPVQGDLRLLVTRVAGRTHALLYRAVVPGTINPVPFASPVSTITFDQVLDISDRVELAGEEGNYEISVPLTVLGLPSAEALAGLKLRGDIGILRGSGGSTIQRVYWSNKATAIVSDVPSEAELRPNLWGTFTLR